MIAIVMQLGRNPGILFSSKSVDSKNEIKISLKLEKLKRDVVSHILDIAGFLISFLLQIISQLSKISQKLVDRSAKSILIDEGNEVRLVIQKHNDFKKEMKIKSDEIFQYSTQDYINDIFVTADPLSNNDLDAKTVNIEKNQKETVCASKSLLLRGSDVTKMSLI